ncbi:OmpA family protein [Moraxellaceae bacterium AER2_44_116]|nr:OmpA family protein [Moraxellaceae bacterium]TQD00109.1 OmpA family protein [Moraxellaceae bacterium AER2_44_116]
MTTHRLLLAVLISAFSLGTSAGITVTPMASYHWFDANGSYYNTPASKIEHDTGYGISLGYRWDNGLGLELDGQRTKADIVDRSNHSIALGQLTDTFLSLNSYYAFNQNSKVQPFVLLGGGQGKISATSIGSSMSHKDTLANLGLGAFINVSENIAIRAEARGVYNFDESKIKGRTSIDKLALVGVQYSFGAAKTAPVVAVQPEQIPVVVQPTPIEVVAPIVVPADDDKDGIINTNDNCANTPANVTVDTMGCPIDSDKDSVADYVDQCPATPAGALVEATGCPKTLTEALKEEIKVVFDTNKADIKNEFNAEISKVATLAKQYPTAKIEIQGYTDSRGNKTKNEALSQNRANAVKDALINGYAVDANRISAKGFGSANPIADNKTDAGRAQNRRVIAVLTGEVKKIQMAPKP